MRRDAQRNHSLILSAAERAVDRNPDVTLADIAEAAGLGRRTVFRHFDTREQLLAELISRVRADLRDAIDEPCRTLPVHDALPAIARPVIEAMLRVGELRPQDFDRRAPASAEEDVAPLVELLRRGREAGDVRADQPLEWQFTLTRIVAREAATLVRSGRATPAQAAELWSQTLDAAFGVPSR